jgi:oxygen-independent coproporphyrinogen-3 oxidase
VGKRTELIGPYLDALLREIRHVGKLAANSGCRVRTIYMGGGTPTTLSSQQMALLMDTVAESFDLSHLLEYTVEGGRPDTLNAEKLRVIRNHGANRMSINPQTMIDAVLKKSARPHTAADVLRAYGEAVDAGFDAINMDLIAGLPGDDFEGFCHSLDTVAALRPANITVHTLALKKDADLFQRREDLPSAEEVTRMVEYASVTLRSLGYEPYYLYRQKYMSGSFENVGWSLPGQDCLYNIYMMEEVHSIVSVGGGSISKRNMSDGTLQRFPNPKFPEQYIEMLDSVLEKKKEMFDLLR